MKEITERFIESIKTSIELLKGRGEALRYLEGMQAMKSIVEFESPEFFKGSDEMKEFIEHFKDELDEEEGKT
ncbi:hypothetical protein SH580_14050 [Coraliomargarita algicola]|uniref:Uncharacterized protein n=1 Tax=Coraliomargarita algicola TaxID=3092156 RepID=A0ABZ0RHH9_9BACT|nr:hypothetical protein [Coraliomargarita sp. J2-16]WPJ94553.1 hypothetical protein SH580_14050 [Coraliomargarita sp. J2-16]